MHMAKPAQVKLIRAHLGNIQLLMSSQLGSEGNLKITETLFTCHLLGESPLLYQASRQLQILPAALTRLYLCEQQLCGFFGGCLFMVLVLGFFKCSGSLSCSDLVFDLRRGVGSQWYSADSRNQSAQNIFSR